MLSSQQLFGLKNMARPKRPLCSWEITMLTLNSQPQPVGEFPKARSVHTEGNNGLQIWRKIVTELMLKAGSFWFGDWTSKLIIFFT